MLSIGLSHISRSIGIYLEIMLIFWCDDSSGKRESGIDVYRINRIE